MKRVAICLLSVVVAGVGLMPLGCSPALQLGSLQPDGLFTLGKERYENGKYVKAVEAFQTLVYNFPGEPVIDTAQYYLALSYFASEDYILAEREFNRLLLNYPSSVYVVHAQFMRAVCFFEGTPGHYGLDQSDLTEAIGQFEDFIIDHPESELMPDARAYLLQAKTRLAKKYYESGMVYVHIGRPSPAATYFQKVIDDFTDTEFAARSSFQMAELEFKRMDYEEARRLFDNFLIVFSDHEWSDKARKGTEEAAFKQAERAYKSGEPALARKLFEAFKRDFPESKRTGKTDKYLKKIGEMPVEGSSVEQASSGDDR
ncbi:MAG TPA: outer membrane protein assembly factor BamD [Acidobacteriota bacterium]|nr:outer membrane protein assembly factor BamD [Acidobacteriota bacterium]